MYTSLPLRAVVYGMQRYEIYNTKKAARGLNLALGASQSLVLLLLRKSKKNMKSRQKVQHFLSSKAQWSWLLDPETWWLIRWPEVDCWMWMIFTRNSSSSCSGPQEFSKLHLGGQLGVSQTLGALTPELSFKLLPLTWPIFGYCRNLGSSSADGRSFCLSFLLCVSLSTNWKIINWGPDGMA